MYLLRHFWRMSNAESQTARFYHRRKSNKDIPAERTDRMRNQSDRVRKADGEVTRVDIPSGERGNQNLHR